MIDLSLLRFDPEAHRYTYNGRELSGVTSLMKRTIFADKYIDIPDEILRKAAERGTAIHQECELVDALGIEPTSDEACAYLSMRERAGLTAEATEVLITDGEYIASAIDCVLRDAQTGKLILADIKCTAKLDILYLRWQLSIYRYLYRLCFGIEADRLMAFHLPRTGKPRMVEIEPIEEEYILALIQADRDGTEYESKYRLEDYDTPPEDVADDISDLRDIERQIDILNRQRDSIREKIGEAMNRASVERWTLPDASLCIVPASTRRTFDAKAFAKDHPKMAEGYYKETTTKEQIRITLR